MSLVTFLENKGWSNPYSHLKSCYGRGQDSKTQEITICDLYQKALVDSRKKGGTILHHFQRNALSEYDRSMYRYIRLIVMKNTAVSIVEDEDYRQFAEFKVPIGAKTIVSVIFKLVALVEQCIGDEMEGSRGALMYDGWSCADTHYIAAVASYNTSVPTRVDGKSEYTTIPRLVLLALSPLGKVPNDEEGDEHSNEYDEATSFNADTHYEFFKTTFPYYGLDFDAWCVCLISDNTATNVKISRLCRKPFVGCNSHLLNLEVNSMVKQHDDLNSSIETVHETMREAKQLKNAALLRNITDYHPVMFNRTRWSGKYRTLKRFDTIRDALIEVSEAPDGNLSVNRSTRFASKVRRYARMLGEIDVVTRSLQTRGYTFAACRRDLDVLIESVRDDARTPGTALHLCRLGTKYIGIDAEIVPDKTFLSAVVKIQNGECNNLTPDEKATVSDLRSSSSQVTNVLSQNSSMEERLSKRRKISSAAQEYVNCDFILGSVAEVERIWSISKHVLTVERRLMTPQLFESIVFLKYNERFWNEQLVSKAIKSARIERAEELINSHDAYEIEDDLA